MGRPIKKKFFGNLNLPGYAIVSSQSGIGGEAIATITNNNTATSYATGTYALSITAPQLPGGTTAAATVSMVDGGVSSISITNYGIGYTSAPTVTLTSASTTGTTATFVATLADTVTTQNALAVSAWVPGGSEALAGDIVKQESTKRYLVKTSEGVGQCKLVTAAPAAEGQMTLTATDSSGKTYYVTKLTAHRAVLTQYGTAGHEFATGSSVQWNISTPVLNTSVTISNN